MTHNKVRQRGYWIIGGTSAVANPVSRCVVCRKLRAPLVQQKLADLPKDRIEPAPPFTYSAVDYFGPFLLKEGRKEVKRYGVLFTCMVSHAIHIEYTRNRLLYQRIKAFSSRASSKKPEVRSWNELCWRPKRIAKGSE